jgi:hypothetical protein
MSTLDTAADKLRSKSEELSAQGGVKAKLGELLAEDAAFLPKLKPDLIRKRIKGDAPTDQAPTQVDPPKAPSGPQLGSRPKAKRPSPGGGVNPFVVVGAAVLLGVALAKWLDLRGHAHPRW